MTNNRIGSTGLTLMVANTVVGTGIIGVVALAPPASPVGLAALLGAFALSLVTALCFARLAWLIDGDGGPLSYVDMAFGPRLAALAGTSYYVARPLAGGASLALAAHYLLPGTNSVHHALFVVGATLTGVAIARAGLPIFGKINAVFALLKLPVVALLLVTATITPPVGAPNNFYLAVLLYAYCFAGFENATLLRNEVSGGGRSVAIAIVLGLAIALMTYALPAVIHLRHAERPTVDHVLGIVILLGMPGFFVVAPRMLEALALQGSLPPLLGRRVGGEPRLAILVNALLIVTSGVALDFLDAAVSSLTLRLVLYAMCAGALFKIGRVPADRGLAIVSLVACAFALPGVTKVSFLLLGIALAAAAPMLWRRKSEAVARN